MATGLLTGRLTADQVEFPDAGSPDRLLEQITAPTLLLQGTVDTMFSLHEAHENAEVLLGNGVPTMPNSSTTQRVWCWATRSRRFW